MFCFGSSVLYQDLSGQIQVRDYIDYSCVIISSANLGQQKLTFKYNLSCICSD